MSDDQPLLEFVSHIGGKNAKVRLWTDRLEWSRKGWMGTGTKAGIAIATGGLSYLATGIRGKQDGQTIPIRSISHVQRGTSRLQDKVTVSTSGGDLEMRVARAEADRLVSELNALINGTHQALQPIEATAQQTQQTQPAEAAPDHLAQLHKLGELRDAGILSNDEFETKKTEILARM